MAKKKAAHQTQDPKQENPHHHNSLKDEDQTKQQHSMEDTQEQLKNLKSLNAMLLKQTVEKRQQVESLEKANKGLDAKLSRFVEEKIGLETDLTRASEDMVSLEIEKGVFCVFIEAQMAGMRENSDLVQVLESEKREKEHKVRVLENEVKGLMAEIENEKEKVSQVSLERDLLRDDVKNWVRENDGLKVKVSEIEKKQRDSNEEVVKLRKQCGLLVNEKNEKEREILEVKRIRDLVEKKLVEKERVVEELRGGIEDVVREKDGIEIEKSGLKAKICEFEREVRDMNDTVLSLRKEEGVLRGKVLELEKRLEESMEKEKTMARDVNGLAEEKKDQETTIQKLLQERDAGQKINDRIGAEMVQKNGLIEKLLREKREIENVKLIKESEILELNSEVGGLRDHVLAMEKSIKEKEDKITQLVSEVRHFKAACEQVRLERDNAQNDLDEERNNCMNLRSKLVRMEATVEETGENLAKMKDECENLTKEKKEIASQIGLLVKEKALAQENLLNAQKRIDDLSTKMESVGSNAERALNMLKDTAALVCQSTNGKDKMVVTEKKLDGEVDPYATELEVIKKSFINKEVVVDDMKQQVEFLRKSVAEAKKNGGFLALVSSATTFFAAVTVAYFAKLR